MTSFYALRTLAGACAIVLAGAGVAAAQDKGPVTYVGPSATVEPAAPQGQPAPEAQPGATDNAAYDPAQLDQMLAPIALYPDELLGQILMASTYPLEVVEAARWIQDPANSGLKGDDLKNALEQKDWDPSVKSLVAFPDVLKMMNDKLDWTQKLGDAFLAQQAAVMDEVQHLRREAKNAGKLASSSQLTVTDNGDNDITVEPANPNTVYVPYYDPTVVYGPWPYPAYPPYYFPYPAGVVFAPGFYFGFGFGINIGFWGPFWGWNHWDWHNHNIWFDRDRFARINHGVPPRGGNTWFHDPAHRRGVAYHDSDSRARYGARGGAGTVHRAGTGHVATPGAHPGTGAHANAPRAYSGGAARPNPSMSHGGVRSQPSHAPTYRAPSGRQTTAPHAYGGGMPRAGGYGGAPHSSGGAMHGGGGGHAGGSNQHK